MTSRSSIIPCTSRAARRHWSTRRFWSVWCASAARRTACDDGLGGAHNQHDANFITFHRIAGFRDLTMEDSAPVERIEETTVEADDFTAVGYGFEKAPFGEGAEAFARTLEKELDDGPLQYATPVSKYRYGGRIFMEETQEARDEAAMLDFRVDEGPLQREAADFEGRIAEIVASDPALSEYVKDLKRREFAQ